MTPIERAARSAADYQGEDWDSLSEVNLAGNGELDRSHFIETVRAVLQAFREPGPGMMGAGSREIIGEHPNSSLHAIAVWQAMIDAALEEDT